VSRTLLDYDLLFLDMDGVVNGRSYFSYRGTEAGRARRSHFFANHDVKTALELTMTDPACAKRLSDLIHKLGCKVIISSSWRDNRKPENFVFLFEALDCPLPKNTIIGCTPVLDEIQEKKRGHEIETWLEANGAPRRYLVLDDDCPSLFLAHQPLYTTSKFTGITDQDTAKIAQFFA
jgi:hypothetical protein